MIIVDALRHAARHARVVATMMITRDALSVLLR